MKAFQTPSAVPILRSLKGRTGNKPHRRTPWNLGVALIGMLIIGAAPDAIPGESAFRMNLDYAIFYDQANNPYVEIYYAFDKSEFVFVSGAEGAKQAEALIAARITKGSTVVVNDAWRMQFQTDDQASTSRIVDVVRYAVDPGRYELTLSTTDLNDQSRRDSITVTLEINPYRQEGLVLSDIELASNIMRSSAEKKSSFFKNTLEVIPNPGGLYGEGRPMLFFYLEAYNLLNTIDGSKYRMRCWVTDRDGVEVAECPATERVKGKNIDASVEVGTVDVSKLHSGRYHLNLGIGEVGGDYVARRRKEFFVQNISEIEAARRAKMSGLSQSVFANWSEAQLDAEFDIVQYLLNDEGKSLYKSLESTDAKRNFLYSFWKSRDPSPGTLINENREAYLERKEYADRKFRRMGREGWKTDRGRVYMVYGKPNDIEYFPSSPQYYPYEIWTYEGIEGGVEFVFVDATGFNEYVLVHSSATGEIQDYNWRNRRARVLR